MNAEVLKQRPAVLDDLSGHLFGQLEGFVLTSDPGISQQWEDRECTVEEREVGGACCQGAGHVVRD